MTTPSIDSQPARPGRRRGVLAGIALVLACVSLLLFSLTAWTHQVALNTDRFTTIVEEVSTDPAVTDAVAHRLAVQVVDAVGVQERLEARLPDALDPLAASFALAIQDGIETRLQEALRDPDLQEAWVAAISRTHRAIVALLRDEAEAAVVIDGYVYFDAFVLVGPALDMLQDVGIIPADVVLPDLTADEARDALSARLEGAIGVTLPETFGLVKLMPADRLLAARDLVRAFDLLVVLLAVVTVALALLAIWLAARRRRMIVFLGVGAVVVLVLARLAIRGVSSAVVSGITDTDASTTIRSVLDSTVANLVTFTNWVLLASAIVAIAAYLSGRPRWAVATADAARSAAGRVGGAASGAAAGAVAAGTAARPSADEVREATRANRARIERLGLALIVFVLAWIALGAEIAVIGAALVVVFYLALALLTGEEEDESEMPDETSVQAIEESAPQTEPGTDDAPPALEAAAADGSATPTSYVTPPPDAGEGS